MMITTILSKFLAAFVQLWVLSVGMDFSDVTETELNEFLHQLGCTCVVKK